MTKKIEIGEAVSLYIPQKDKERFWNIIQESGYEANGKGVLNFVLESPDFEDEDWEEDLYDEMSIKNVAMEGVKKWASEHPEEWSRVKEKGSSALRSLINKVASKL